MQASLFCRSSPQNSYVLFRGSVYTHDINIFAITGKHMREVRSFQTYATRIGLVLQCWVVHLDIQILPPYKQSLLLLSDMLSVSFLLFATRKTFWQRNCRRLTRERPEQSESQVAACLEYHGVLRATPGVPGIELMTGFIASYPFRNCRLPLQSICSLLSSISRSEWKPQVRGTSNSSNLGVAQFLAGCAENNILMSVLCLANPKTANPKA